MNLELYIQVVDTDGLFFIEIVTKFSGHHFFFTEVTLDPLVSTFKKKSKLKGVVSKTANIPVMKINFNYTC